MIMCSASQPSLLAQVGGDAQREALLAQQGVAAVARADAPDQVVLREVHDEPPVGVEVADRVQAFDEVRRRCRFCPRPACSCAS